MPEQRDGLKHVHTFPPNGETIVSMVEYRGHMYVATTEAVYRIENDCLKKLELVFDERTDLAFKDYLDSGGGGDVK